MARKATNVSLDPKLIEAAKEMNVNISRAAEDGLRAALTEKWRRDNAEAIDAINAWVEENGLPLAKSAAKNPLRREIAKLAKSLHSLGSSNAEAA